MKLLVRCDQTLQAAHIANALRAAGIRCEVRNTTLSSAIGDIPWLECAPQVWILDDLDEPRARQLLRELMQPAGGPTWRCANCGEELEPQFGACWACGTQRA
ncbi:MAG: DUF2007 domain-containing protein [Gemmatimonadota bacterium]